MPTGIYYFVSLLALVLSRALNTMCWLSDCSNLYILYTISFSYNIALKRKLG
jgi:hypothetical protein